MGVDVFFVISGFVVSGSLLRKQQPSSAAFLAAFYARRVKRLAPALIAVVFVTSLLLAHNLSALMPALDGYLVSGMFALVGWANQHFATLPTGYFDEGADGLPWNTFTHCWSLGFEQYLRMDSNHTILQLRPIDECLLPLRIGSSTSSLRHWYSLSLATVSRQRCRRDGCHSLVSPKG